MSNYLDEAASLLNTTSLFEGLLRPRGEVREHQPLADAVRDIEVQSLLLVTHQLHQNEYLPLVSSSVELNLSFLR